MIQNATSFRAEREADWLRLEALLKRIENRSPRALCDDDLLALPLLYRSTLSSLSVARATLLDRALIDHLESLSLRAYLMIYGASGGFGKRFARFFITDWPGAVRLLWRETIVALLILIAGTVAGYVLVGDNPEWFGVIVGQDVAQGRGPYVSAQLLKSILYDSDHRADALKFFATYLFTHNAQISLMCFALGFAFGVPTLMLLFYNGASLGAMLQIYVAKGLGLPIMGWLSIHGTTELFAIVVSAAAGLHIGTRIAFPGGASRMAAGASAGRTGGIAMVGVIVMLAVAGLLEGIGRQTINTDGTRLIIGVGMLIFWLVYYYGPGFKSRG